MSKINDLFKSPHQVRTKILYSIDELYPLLDWCEDNLSGEMINYVTSDQLVWCFESSADAMMFALRCPH